MAAAKAADMANAAAEEAKTKRRAQDKAKKQPAKPRKGGLIIRTRREAALPAHVVMLMCLPCSMMGIETP